MSDNIDSQELAPDARLNRQRAHQARLGSTRIPRIAAYHCCPFR
jgi:hypothetical protein